MTTLVTELTNIQKNVAVPKKDGGTYMATVLSFVQNGFQKDIRVAQAFLGKNAALAGQLDALSVGDRVEILMEKNGAFNNLKSVVKTDRPLTQPQPKKTGFTPGVSKGGSDNVGMRVGNTVTNVVQLAAIVKKTDEKTLKELADQLIKLGDYIEAKLKAPKTQETPAVSASELNDAFRSDELPF